MTQYYPCCCSGGLNPLSCNMDEIQLYAGVNKTNSLSFLIRIYGKDIGMSFRHVAVNIRYPAKLVCWQYEELDA